MPVKRARFYDIVALLIAIVVVALDQWTKALVVKNVPLFSQIQLPLVGKYIGLEHIHNSGAAFSMFSGGGSIFLTIFIIIAIVVVGYLYVKMLDTGHIAYKPIFGLIIGGACGNLIDRVIHSGYVIDFISFRIPEVNFYFAIFNVADACISIGVILLFIFIVFSGNVDRKANGESTLMAQEHSKTTTIKSDTLHTTEQDAQH